MKIPKQKISAQQVRDAINYEIWNIGNGVLYDLCSRHPDHTNIGAVSAKCWLIGRSYAASVERYMPDMRFVSRVAAKPADSEYQNFCSRVAWILEEIKHQHGESLLPRQVDNLFLRLGS